MKHLFNINSETLLKALKKVNKIKVSRVFEYLNGIYLKIIDDKLIIRRTDLEIDILVPLDVLKLIDSETGRFDFLVNYELIEKGVSLIKNEELSFYLKDDKVLIIKHLKGTFEIGLMDYSNYPKEPEFIMKQGFVIPLNVFEKSIQLSSLFSSNDDLIPMMAGLHINYSSKFESMDFVSTNSRILFKKKYNINCGNVDFKLTIPNTSFSSILNIFEKGIDNIIIDFNESHLKIETAGISIFIRLLIGSYPNYVSVIPDTFDYQIKFEKQEFLNSLSQIHWALDNSGSFNLLHTEDNNILFITNNIEFSKGASVKCNHILTIGEKMDKRFNHKYMINCIKGIESINLNLNITSGLRPCYLNSDDDEQSIFLLMPNIN
jgi:DNA polymerase-3 subunit beta